MKSLIAVGLSLIVFVGAAACGSSGDSGMSPEQLHEACLAVFERKNGPADIGQQMCASMKAACERDPGGEECSKARRMVERG